MKALRALFVRDLRLALRIGGGALVGLLFFSLRRGADSVRDRARISRCSSRIGPAILWLGALLACLLALDRLFAADHEDGSLDLHPAWAATPLELTVAAKALRALADHRVAAGRRGAVARPVA